MSFSIILHKVISGAEGTCSSQEAIDLVEILQKYSSETPDKNSEITIDLKESQCVTMRVWPDPNAITGCWFKITSVSKPLISLVYEIATAGNFVIINTSGADSDDDPLAIVLTKTTLTELGEGTFNSPYFCHRKLDLLRIFSKAFGDSSAFEKHAFSQISKNFDYEWDDMVGILDALQVASGQTHGKQKLDEVLNRLTTTGRIKIKLTDKFLTIENKEELQTLLMSYDSTFKLKE